MKLSILLDERKDENLVVKFEEEEEDKEKSSSQLRFEEKRDKKVIETVWDPKSYRRKRRFYCYSDCSLTFEELTAFIQHLVGFHQVKVIRAPYSYWLQWNLDIFYESIEMEIDTTEGGDGEERGGRRWSTIVICQEGTGVKIFLFKVEQDTNEEGILGDYHIQIWNLNNTGTYLAIVRFSEGGYQGQWVWPLVAGQRTTQAILPKAATEHSPLTKDNRRILTLLICLQPQKSA